MIRESTRSLTTEEFGRLKAHINYFDTRPRSLGCALSSGIVTFLVALLAVSFSAPLATFGGTLSLVAAVAVGALVYWRWPRAHLETGERQRLEQDLAARELVATTYAVADAIQVEEFEDEGLTFFLLLDDDRVLIVNGQYLYDPVANGEAPARFVTVARGRHSSYVFGVTFSGEPLRPSTVRSHLTEREWEEFSFDGDGSFLGEPFEILRHPRG